MEKLNEFEEELYGSSSQTSGMMDGLDTDGLSLDSLDSPTPAKVTAKAVTQEQTPPQGAYQQNAYQQNAYQQNAYQQNTYNAQAYAGVGGGYTPARQKSVENVPMGIVGAVIGTALGLVVWCLIGMLGYISAIGGLAIAAGAFFGYTLLGKDVSKTGVVVIAALVIIAVLVGTRMVYAIDLRSEFKEYAHDEDFQLVAEYAGIDTQASTLEIFVNLDDYFETFDKMLAIIGEDSITSEYHGNLVKGYFFTGWERLCLCQK